MKKVSKSQKEILDFPHAPKNHQDFVLFSALASKGGQIKRTGSLYHVKWSYKVPLFFIWPLFRV